MTKRQPHATRLRYIGVMASAVAVVMAASVFTQSAARQDLSEGTVVARLQSGGPAYSADVKAALRAVRDNPGDLAAAKSSARVLINEGRNAGDTRLVGAALAVLRSHRSAPDAEVSYLSATALQYQHDFPGALALLDEAWRRDPADVNVVLTRATIQIVLGRFDLAAQDCNRLFALSRADLGFLCQATNRLLTRDAPQIADKLTAILAQPTLLDPSLHGWARGLIGEIAALHGDRAVARGHFADVLAQNPLALRERLLLVDLLLMDGMAAKALAALEPAIPADGVLIRRVLAAQAMGNTDLAAEDSRELAARFKLNIDLGLLAHAREEALYFLRIAKDPEMALQRALVNWDLQHEIEDAQLLVDAAVFAGKPEAATPVVRWMRDASVVVPSFRLPDAVREAAR